MHALTGKNLQFYTAPIAGYGKVGNQDVEPDRRRDDPGGHQGEVRRPGACRQAASSANPGAKAALVRRR